jgi:hypothetical protein
MPRHTLKTATTLLLVTVSAVALSTSLVTCTSGKVLTRPEALDPASCKTCHPQQYAEWTGSMHAYASDDPVFLAMNARGQRETGGQLGGFCVNCHAPMAVREKATVDGTNLATVPAKLKGVSCYFCHDVDGVTDTHDAPLHLAGDLIMRGPFSDPIANVAHPSAHSNLDDRDHLDSAKVCGSCHDIVNGHGAAIERTFAEWNASVFSQPPIGDTCGQCHMNQSKKLTAIANVPNAPLRRTHSHAMPGVDSALIPFPGADAQAQAIKDLLDPAIQSAVCVATSGFGVDVILDNVAAGHGFPSGSGQDRRLWVELVAYQGGSVIYQSGVVPDGTAVTSIADPDLWLMRDCMLDDQQKQVSMFWQAFGYETTALPGAVTLDPMDKQFYLTHVYRSFPVAGAGPNTVPDRVTMRVRLRPMDDALIDDLIASQDLDPSVRASLLTLEVGQPVEWTPATATTSYARNGIQYACVTNTNYNFQADKVPAPSPPHCTP